MPARTTAALCASASALALSLALYAANPAYAEAPASHLQLAMSSLGDLSSFRTIASDTLKIVDKGDITAARTRIKDLETSWDKAEATLKPKDKATWTTLDKMIDAALTDLRTPSPKVADCAASLKALIAKMDDADRA